MKMTAVTNRDNSASAVSVTILALQHHNFCCE